MTEQQSLLGGEDPLDAVVTELRKYENWPVDDGKDRKFVAELAQKYPKADLLTEAFNWVVWMMDHNQKKEVKPRARFVTWIRNSQSYRLNAASSGKNRKNSSRTAPARPESFGAESSARLSGW